MPDRADELKEIEALDQRVDELLSEVEETAERIDAAIPVPPDAADAQDFAEASDILDQVNADLARAEEGGGETSGFESAADAMEEAAADLRAIEEPESRVEAAASEPEPEPMSAEEFSSPDAIKKLDERLAASASDLSASAGDVVDDSEMQEQVIASERGHEPVPVATEPVPATVAAVPAKPAAHPPRPAPEPKPVSVPVEAAPAKSRMSLSSIAAAPLAPLANFTERMSPGARQTIAYAAVVTLFQAACLWGFLVFKGPPGEPVPTSDPVTLRQAEELPKAKSPGKPSAKSAAEAH